MPLGLANPSSACTHLEQIEQRWRRGFAVTSPAAPTASDDFPDPAKAGSIARRCFVVRVIFKNSAHTPSACRVVLQAIGVAPATKPIPYRWFRRTTSLNWLTARDTASDARAVRPRRGCANKYVPAAAAFEHRSVAFSNIPRFCFRLAHSLRLPVHSPPAPRQSPADFGSNAISFLYIQLLAIAYSLRAGSARTAARIGPSLLKYASRANFAAARVSPLLCARFRARPALALLLRTPFVRRRRRQKPLSPGSRNPAPAAKTALFLFKFHIVPELKIYPARPNPVKTQKPLVSSNLSVSFLMHLALQSFGTSQTFPFPQENVPFFDLGS